MTRRALRNHSAAFKAKVAIAANKGERTISQIAEQFDVHPNQVVAWKAQIEGGATEVFDGGGTTPAALAVDVRQLSAKIGGWTLESYFFGGWARQGGIVERIGLKARLRHDTMIDRDHTSSVTKQAEAVGIARNTAYYLLHPVSAADLDHMQRIDRLHLELPLAGSRMLRRLLAAVTATRCCAPTGARSAGVT